MKQTDDYGYSKPPDTPAMKAVKKAIKEIAVEEYLKKRLYDKEAPAWKKAT